MHPTHNALRKLEYWARRAYIWFGQEILYKKVLKTTNYMTNEGSMDVWTYVCRSWSKSRFRLVLLTHHRFDRFLPKPYQFRRICTISAPIEISLISPLFISPYFELAPRCICDWVNCSMSHTKRRHISAFPYQDFFVKYLTKRPQHHLRKNVWKKTSFSLHIMDRRQAYPEQIPLRNHLTKLMLHLHTKKHIKNTTRK